MRGTTPRDIVKSVTNNYLGTIVEEKGEAHGKRIIKMQFQAEGVTLYRTAKFFASIATKIREHLDVNQI